MVGPGQFDALTSNTDYEKELALYDQFVSMGVVDKEKSYITKAEGSSITFLRGEKKNIKNAFDEKYNKYIALAISNGEVNDEDGLFMLHRRLSKRMFKSAAT